MNHLVIRSAIPENTELLYNFILQPAQYEAMTTEGIATLKILRESLFIKHQAEWTMYRICGSDLKRLAKDDAI